MLITCYASSGVYFSINFTPCQLNLFRSLFKLDTMSSKEKNTRARILHETWQLMEQRIGKTISMSDVAKAAGISRQAVYLHFESRTDLLVATSKYVDQLKGLDDRLSLFKSATTGTQMLHASVEVWGNFMPEIYGLAKALMATRDSDEATAAVWDGNMAYLKSICAQTITSLKQEGKLAPEWTEEDAISVFWTMISVNNWEQLTKECGWSNAQYIEKMQHLLMRTFVADAV